MLDPVQTSIDTAANRIANMLETIGVLLIIPAWLTLVVLILYVSRHW